MLQDSIKQTKEKVINPDFNMITEEHRRILRQTFGYGVVRRVHEYMVKNQSIHPRSGRVPSYSHIRHIYNGHYSFDKTSIAEDEFIEEKIFEAAEAFKLEKIQHQKDTDAKAERLKDLK